MRRLEPRHRRLWPRRSSAGSSAVWDWGPGSWLMPQSARRLDRRRRHSAVSSPDRVTCPARCLISVKIASADDGRGLLPGARMDRAGPGPRASALSWVSGIRPSDRPSLGTLLDSDQLADRLPLIEQGHRPAAAVGGRGGGVDAEVVVKSLVKQYSCVAMLDLQASPSNPKSTIPAEHATGPTCSCDGQDGHRSGKLAFRPIEPECPRSV